MAARRDYWRAWSSKPDGWAKSCHYSLKQRHPGEAVATHEQIRALVDAQGFKCAVTGYPLDFTIRDKHPMQPTLDHIVPVSRGGSGEASNLRVTIWAWNVARGNGAHDGALARLLTKVGPPFMAVQGA